MCWVALDRGVRLVEAGLLHTSHLARGIEVRERIRAAIEQEGWSDRVGAFAQSFGSDELDASALLLGIVGFLPADDPRLLATIDRIEAGLSDEHGLLYRYRGADGLPSRRAPSCSAPSGWRRRSRSPARRGGPGPSSRRRPPT